jgi:hypothetical protein
VSCGASCTYFTCGHNEMVHMPVFASIFLFTLGRPQSTCAAFLRRLVRRTHTPSPFRS